MLLVRDAPSRFTPAMSAAAALRASYDALAMLLTLFHTLHYAADAAAV